MLRARILYAASSAVPAANGIQPHGGVTAPCRAAPGATPCLLVRTCCARYPVSHNGRCSTSDFRATRLE
ncbi:hypothetical protein B0H19DRAFT_1123072, partial [Mycena capillaripes]